MASPKKAAAKKTAARKAATPKVKTTKAAVAKPEIKKGSKLACQVCGFAVTVDRLCGCAEEVQFICCGTPMKVERTTRKGCTPTECLDL